MLQKLLPKNVAHKVVEKTDEFFRKKFADKTVKPKPVSDENLLDVEEIIIPPGIKDRTLNELSKHI